MRLGAGLLLSLGACSSTPSPSTASEQVVASAIDATPPVEAAQDVHGTLTMQDGVPLLRVWGTPREMGHAHGYLLRERIIAVVDGYALDAVPPATLAAAGAVLERSATIAPSLREEAEGIIAGMRAAGGARIDRLDRELVVADLLALNAMTDLIAVGCSSVSAWGDAIAGEGPVVVRNLDWSDDADLLANQIVIVTMPSDPQRQPLASIAFAGYIGCLSCVSEAGVTALFNMGYGDGAGGPTAMLGAFAPANLLVRDALERRDVDGDGRSSADDIEQAVRAATHVGSWILHVVEPGVALPARVLEVEADGVVARRAGTDALGDELLAATNHLRAKSEPRECYRYDRIAGAARRHPLGFSREDLWRLAVRVRLPEVVHTIMVELDDHRISVWLRKPGERDDATVDRIPLEWSTLSTR
ncbi:MAG TPA: C45 family peptidase [Nannocystaceae bacterium]|nr:C45 family peptidase [Nannocystaceae bacterium]